MNKEQIYDQQINPLMAQIIEICKANKIAMLCTFHTPNEEDDGLHCSTALLDKDYDPPSQYLEILNFLRPKSSPMLMVTTRNAQGEVAKMEAIL